jgi:hypothetical protein
MSDPIIYATADRGVSVVQICAEVRLDSVHKRSGPLCIVSGVGIFIRFTASGTLLQSPVVPTSVLPRVFSTFAYLSKHIA